MKAETKKLLNEVANQLEKQARAETPQVQDMLRDIVGMIRANAQNNI